MLPLGYLVGLILVIVLPVVGCGSIDVSVMIVWRRVCSPCVSAFLLVVDTPPLGLGGLEFGPNMVLPRWFVCLIVTMASASGMLKKIFLIFAFLMWSYFTSCIFIFRKHLMLW